MVRPSFAPTFGPCGSVSGSVLPSKCAFDPGAYRNRDIRWPSEDFRRELVDSKFHSSDRIRVDILSLISHLSHRAMVWDSVISLPTWNLGMLAFLPVGGLPPAQELNSQPLFPTVVGGASSEPVPDSFSAGAEMIELKPAFVRLS